VTASNSFRLESIDVAGALGAAVAHELRNMLAAASSSIFLAKRDLDKRDRLLGHLDAAEAELHRSQDVIERVLKLVRGEPIHRETCLLLDVVTAAQRNVRPDLVRIEIDLAPDELEVSCEPLLVERLLTNLLQNAIEAFPAESSGTIVVRARQTDSGFFLEVEDNGPGFDPSVIEKLFQPGVTTKSTGTGLGLLLCRSITRVHGGDMQVERSAMGGALVRCEFVRDPENQQ
jgi:two-component system, NtrC family, sensor histidine kinase HydH